MKIMKELRDLPAEEMKSRLEEFKKELLKLNVEVATGANPSSPGKLKQTKKNIARILTLLNEKEVKNK
ncbi:MAG: 50S ribosomal protein L29 [Nanoarchaeota archaeon]|nr:50S ribosomal protein L29 [Nanoarchaeota archaeon]MBU1622637.1 50S ribosomal protein L29 [Nanoarchaeota archaeon]MBU1974277.1 50S ribosomal protein L29 [Nanoarchaeota archaeon]